MKGRPRRDAVSPFSAGWTLYHPNKLRDWLLRRTKECIVSLPQEDKERVVDFILSNLTKDVMCRGLEQTGFSKAVRIREELIKEKTRLLIEQRTVGKRLLHLHRRIKVTKRVHNDLARRLVMIRNILRIPREDRS